ncbi:DUF2512 family protein [Heliorestis acidaminivorans]|uniref:DUF2512 family protein n=1 Tax=Heliorestis acidaminivorans TaxID=553427 RepID=UPI00242AB4EA|nr:DUF2512 family protein [Heliorestis acidaminivorans]
MLQALLFKFLLTLVASVVTLGLFVDNPWGIVILFAIWATSINYLIGDMVILPRNGNFVASVSDGVLAAFSALVLSFLIPFFQAPLFALLALGLLIAVGEALFHLYLKEKKHILP